MWLLRDVHLEPTKDGKRVSIDEYFIDKVLKKERGFKKEIQERQWIRSVFLQMFNKYNAFTLPMPHSNVNILRKLGQVSRDRLHSNFNQKLQQFYDLVLNQVECKTLFTKDLNGLDQFIECDGPHLAEWIKQCVDAVNDPNKIPRISSMTGSVISNIYINIKKTAIKEYTQMMNIEMNKLRNYNPLQPLNQNIITKLHNNVLNNIFKTIGKDLISSQFDDEKQNVTQVNQQQIKILNEFYDEIGHNQDISQIGQKGYLHVILTENKQLSKEQCTKYLHNGFTQNIEPLLHNPQHYTQQNVMEAMNNLQIMYYDNCKGPSRDDCWQQFRINLSRELEYFNRNKQFTDKISKLEFENNRMREENKRLKEKQQMQYLQHHQQQISMKNELERIKNIHYEESKEYKNQLEKLNMQQQQINHLTRFAKNCKESIDSLTGAIITMQNKNSDDMKQMFDIMNKTLKIKAGNENEVKGQNIKIRSFQFDKKGWNTAKENKNIYISEQITSQLITNIEEKLKDTSTAYYYLNYGTAMQINDKLAKIYNIEHKPFDQFLMKYKLSKFKIGLSNAGLTDFDDIQDIKNEQDIQDLIKEAKITGSIYKNKLKRAINDIKTDKYQSIQQDGDISEEIVIINYDLHQKMTKQNLYAIIIRNNDMDKCKGHKWELINFLTVKQIENKYNIMEDELPKSSRLQRQYLSQLKKIQKKSIRVQNLNIKGLSQFRERKNESLKQIKIDITIDLFKEYIRKAIVNMVSDNYGLIPNVKMRKNNPYCIEGILIVTIEKVNLDCGISFRCSKKGTMIPTGICLSKLEIQRRYILSGVQGYYHYLNGFKQGIELINFK